jgi:hypothetical protein
MVIESFSRKSEQILWIINGKPTVWDSKDGSGIKGKKKMADRFFLFM